MRIALIAHDAKKKLMQNFCIAYRGSMYISIWPDTSEGCSRSARRSSRMRSTC